MPCPSCNKCAEPITLHPCFTGCDTCPPSPNCTDCNPAYVQQSFTNCSNLSWCTEGCTETISTKCITGCFIQSMIYCTVSGTIETITITPIIFNPGNLGWEVYFNGVLQGTYFGQDATFSFTADGSAIDIKVKDKHKGCEYTQKYVLQNVTNTLRNYQLTIPKRGIISPYGDIDSLVISDLNTSYVGAVLSQTSTSIIATYTNINFYPVMFLHTLAANFCINSFNTSGCINTNTDIGVYQWVQI